MRAAATLLLVLAAAPAAAVEVSICYNYGCLAEAQVSFDAPTMASVEAQLAAAHSAAEERTQLARVVGRLYLEAGHQSPIGADRAGNFLDGGVPGKMDCIDHAASTTRLLRMLEARGALRYHRVLERVRRTRFFVTQHFSAVVEERGGADGEAARFVVDSWFVENGEPAVVLPLVDWLEGEGPDVP